MDNKAFSFFISYHDCVANLDAKEQEQFWGALIRYAFDRKCPEGLPPHLQALFIVVRPNIDSSIEKRENGKKGGKSSKKAK